MGGWRGKLVLLLIIYFAGFSTAIYILFPVPKDSDNQQQNSLSSSGSANEKFAQSYSIQMHKCVASAGIAAKDLGEFIKEKYDQANKNSN
jgi:hypothetical protein